MKQRDLPGFKSAKRPCLNPTGFEDGAAMVCIIPGIKLVNGANAREHWGTRKKRAKEQREAAHYTLLSEFGKVPPSLPLRVTITRLSKGKMDDDGLTISAKHIRDGIADWVGVDDGSSGYTWVVEQEISKSWGVRIRIERREP